MQLTEKWLKETLERNPQLKVKVQGGRNSELEQPGKVEKAKTKYGNHRVYLYEDEYVSGDKYISGHGKLVAAFDSTKEYCRWLDLQLMEKAGTISNLNARKNSSSKMHSCTRRSAYSESCTRQTSVIWMRRAKR